MSDEKLKAALHAEIANYRKTLMRIVSHLESTLLELDSLPLLFHSELYSSGTWQTTVDISVAIKKFNWLINFLENPSDEYLDIHLVLLPKNNLEELRKDYGI